MEGGGGGIGGRELTRESGSLNLISRKGPKQGVYRVFKASPLRSSTYSLFKHNVISKLVFLSAFLKNIHERHLNETTQ